MMKPENYHAFLEAHAEELAWIAAAPVKWDEMLTVNELTRKLMGPDAGVNYSALCEALDRISVQAAMVSEYIGTRKGVNGSGVSDGTHREAVRKCNTRRAKVRRALGFTMPKAGSFTF